MVHKLGRWMPQHEREWTGEQMMDVVTLCHRFADERGWFLTEYVDGKPTRVFYGDRKHES